MEDKNHEHLAKLTEELALSLVPFGYLDLRRSAEVLDESKVRFTDFAEYIGEFCDETQAQFKDIDICYLAYEYIMQEARNQIDASLGVDIINDTDNFYTAGNYMCTSYDYSENSKVQILEWIKEIEETRPEDITKQILFIKNQLD